MTPLAPGLPPTGAFGETMQESSDSEIQSDNDNLERETAKLRAHFEEKMTTKTLGHRSVAVLILYWDTVDQKDVLDVAQLRVTFEELYGFKVYAKKLTMVSGKALDCINLHMAQFMYEEDFEETLLIIYYAGHGGLAMGTSHGLKLTGWACISVIFKKSIRSTNSARFSAQSIGVDSGKDIIWEKAEALLENAKADMLLIFDCCHAARAGNQKKRGPFSQRIYEVLAACQSDELTPGPGDSSFTSALIWALRQLAEPPKAFTTSQLYDMILNSPKYKSQGSWDDGYRPHHPYWSEKAGYHSLHRLKITPKGVQEQQLAKSEYLPAKFGMHIQLLSTEIPSVDDISKLCKKLKDVLHPDDPGSTFHQALWRDFTRAEDQKKPFPHVAEIFTLKLKQKMLQSRINEIKGNSNGESENSISPFSQEDLISSEALLGSRSISRRPTSNAASMLTGTVSNRFLAPLPSSISEKFGWTLMVTVVGVTGFIFGSKRNLTRQ
ncbi:MAG: hypothetical protein Q9227_005135 [Pyrenula ochraceoflavens]